MQYGRYLRTDTRLGEGGNGEVWLCRDGEVEVAVKVLTNLRGKRYARFRSEVGVLESLRDSVGIVPILDSHLPGQPTGAEPAWYAMPKCGSWRSLVAASPRETVEAFADLASSLVSLHAKQVYHRDLKLANILLCGDQWCLSDFGLAEWPGAEDLTTEGETIGPRWTVAPEMRRTARTAQAGPADVYSFAKTLWIALTGETSGFDGRFDPSIAAQNLHTYITNEPYLRHLHATLRDCTIYDPLQRPTMREVHARLRQWLSPDFHDQVSFEWHYMQASILEKRMPRRSVWYDPDEIAGTLNETSNPKNLNHCLFFRSGGLDLTRCEVVDGLVECDFGRIHVINPEFLELVVFKFAPEWSYFWLQLARLPPVHLDDSRPPKPSGHDSPTQEFARLPTGQLLPLSDWIAGCWWNGGDYVSLPTGTVPVVRHLWGSWVIISKASPYNRDTSTYDGRHGTLGREGFYRYMRCHAEWTRNGKNGVPDVPQDGPPPVRFRWEERR